MDQTLEVTHIKNEPTESTSNDRLEIPTEMQFHLIKQESDCLVQSGIHIKTEFQEDENEFPVIANTSYDLCPNYDMKCEMEEPMIKIEYEELLDQLMQDPLNVSDESKDEDATSNLDIERVNSKPGQTEEEEEEEGYLSTSSDEGSHESDALNKQEQLSVRKKKVCKDVQKFIKKFICNVCNKSFEFKRLLDRHLLIHSKGKHFTCKICKRSFNFKCNLDRHVLIHSGEKPHSCDVCSKVFTQKSYLDSHKLIHSGERNFSCNECNKSFTQKQGLVIHQRSHTGEKPFSCTICHKVFINTSNLIVHKRTHTGEKPYSCEVCNKAFSHKSSLNTHKKNHKN